MNGVETASDAPQAHNSSQAGDMSPKSPKALREALLDWMEIEGVSCDQLSYTLQISRVIIVNATLGVPITKDQQLRLEELIGE